MKAVLALALALGVARAACPNACSGHGTCGNNDECSCYNNYGSADCSARICPYFTSWVTTPQGDRNQDGDLFDGTVTSTTNVASNHPTYFNDVTQSIAFFESWPMSKKAGSQGENNDEGHYFMECANQGMCDRKTGQCECFTGYEGVACRRSSCPNQCSGNGVCRTVYQIGSQLSSYDKITYSATGVITARAESNGALNYKFWDKDMSQACVCDGGFTGPDCAQRECPLGDDPLTTGQHNEVQWVDVYADVQFTGSIKFTYTDLFGDKWTTASVTTAHYEGVQGTLASDAQAALRGLPDLMLSSVTVSVNYCESPYTGYHKGTYTSGAIVLAEATNPQGDYSPTSTAPTAPDSGLLRVSGVNTVHDMSDSGNPVYGYDIPADGDVDNKLMYKVEKNFCIRYQVTFDGRSGDIPDIGVDTDGILVPSGVDEASFVADGAGAGAYLDTINGVTQVMGGTGLNALYRTGEVLHVECDGKSFGFTTPLRSISSTVIGWQTTDTTVCGGPANADLKTVKLQRAVGHRYLDIRNHVGSSTSSAPNFAAENYATTQLEGELHDCSTGYISGSTFTCASATGYDAKVHYNEKVKVTCDSVTFGTYTVASSSGDSITFKETLVTCGDSGDVKSVQVTTVDRVVKTDVDVVAMRETDGHDITGLTLAVDDSELCDITELISDSASETSAGTRFKCSTDKAWTSKVVAAGQDAFEGDGSTESAPCSTRGVCDTSVGLCECFKGYSGDDCSTQNALSA